MFFFHDTKPRPERDLESCVCLIVSVVVAARTIGDCGCLSLSCVRANGTHIISLVSVVCVCVCVCVCECYGLNLYSAKRNETSLSSLLSLSLENHNQNKTPSPNMNQCGLVSLLPCTIGNREPCPLVGGSGVCASCVCWVLWHLSLDKSV